MNTKKHEAKIGYAVAVDRVTELAIERQGGNTTLTVGTLNATTDLLNQMYKQGYSMPELLSMGNDTIGMQWVTEYGVASFEVRVAYGATYYQDRTDGNIVTKIFDKFNHVPSELTEGLKIT